MDTVLVADDDREFFESRLNEAYPLQPEHEAQVRPWFSGAGLGLFICWDHASQQGLEMSWPMVGGVPSLPGKPVSIEQYRSTEDSFNPVHWDADALADLASRAGMTYAVFTAKHHSGWAIWPSSVSDHSAKTSVGGRSGQDVLADYVRAFREKGIKVGIYYSLADWCHPDYPAWSDQMRPYTFGVTPPLPDPESWQRFLAFMRAEITELLTDYGPVDLLWFDGAWERTAEQWDSAGIGHMIRDLAPDIVINDRLPGEGDYRTPEQWIPAQPLGEPWECCMTINYSWGYVPDDTEYKSIHEILRTLIEVVSRGGNLLLSIGPKGDGSLDEQEQARLEQLSRWMTHNAPSIHGAGPGLEPWQFYGPTTQNGDTVYLHLLAKPGEQVVVRGVPVRQAKSVRFVATGEELPLRRRIQLGKGADANPLGELIIDTRSIDPDTLVPVIAVDLSGDPADIELNAF